MSIENDDLILLYDNFYYLQNAKVDTKTENKINSKIINTRVLLVFSDMPNDGEKVLLNKILQAAKVLNDETFILSLNDFIINKFEINAEVIIQWNDEFEEDEKYKIEIEKNRKIIKCDSLSKINSNQELKAKLWKILKEIFL